jgi:hypothetical protein
MTYWGWEPILSEDRNGCGWKNIGRYVIFSFVVVVVVVVVIIGEMLIPE